MTQMGIQGHSGEGDRLICEWIWAGLIGEVREVDAWCDLSYYPWGHACWSSAWPERPKETPPVPPHLNWDLWIGPAPMRPYHRAYHPTTWRCYWDFGCGMMGDRGAHTLGRGVLGPAAWRADEHRRHQLRQHGGGASAFGDRDVPIPGAGGHAATEAHVVRRHASAAARRSRRWPPDARRGGRLLQGEQGHDHGRRLRREPPHHPGNEDEGDEVAREDDPASAARTRWSGSTRARRARAADADFAYSGPLTEICLLGNIAKRVDSPHPLGRREPQDHQPAGREQVRPHASIARVGRSNPRSPSPSGRGLG